LLDRLQLDAEATVSSSRRVEHSRGEAPMSPALAQALFAMALLPLLRSGESEQRDPLQALSAYARLNRD
jgi:hypothetical protein